MGHSFGMMEKLPDSRQAAILKVNLALEAVIVSVAFYLSMIDLSFLMICTCLLILYIFFQGVLGAAKGIVILSVRYLIDSGVDYSESNLQTLKWILLFVFSGYIILHYNKMPKENRATSNKIIATLSIFCLYNLMSSIFFSSMPMVSVLKILSYYIIFLGVFLGVGITCKTFDWIKFSYVFFAVIALFNLSVSNDPSAYSVPNDFFMGVFGYSNLNGLFILSFISISLIFIKRISRFKVIPVLMIFAALFMLFLAWSRTATVTIAIVFVVYFLMSPIDIRIKVVTGAFLALLAVSLFMSVEPLREAVMEYLFKHSSGGEDIMYSRTLQFSELIESFKNNLLFGNGFGTPILETKDLSFQISSPKESGNLILALLSEGGFFGILTFFLYFIQFFILKNKRILLVLPVCVLFMNFGEMSFFASNNFGVIIYLMLAIFTFYSFRDNKVVAGAVIEDVPAAQHSL